MMDYQKIEKFDNVNEVELKTDKTDIEKIIKDCKRIINNSKTKLKELMNRFTNAQITWE